jgi:hypothetical protein
MFVMGVVLGQIVFLVLGPVAELFAIPLRLLGFFGGKGGSIWGTMFGRRLIGRVAPPSLRCRVQARRIPSRPVPDAGRPAARGGR